MSHATAFQRSFRLLLVALLGAILPVSAHAQLALESNPYKYASPPVGSEWYSVNPEAWDSFVSGNFTRVVGSGPQQDFTLGVDYTNRVIVYGKKSMGDAVLPTFTWVGPLFGGEGYSGVSGAIPLQSPYAQHLFASGGWRYNLTPDVKIDLGGSVNLYNKSVFGQGLPAPWGYRADSPFWVGLTGNVISSPSLYFTYDPTLGENIEALSVSHVFDLKKLVGIPHLHIAARLTAGLLNADVYNGGNKVLGHNWRNGYSYGELSLDADYEVFHGLYLRLGGEWGINNDGSGNTGIAGTNLGPDNNLSFHGGVLYSF
jgi:hypothetical protein